MQLLKFLLLLQAGTNSLTHSHLSLILFFLSLYLKPSFQQSFLSNYGGDVDHSIQQHQCLG